MSELGFSVPQQIDHTEMGPRFNPITLRKAKIVHNFGLSECNRVKVLFDRLEEWEIEPATPG